MRHHLVGEDRRGDLRLVVLTVLFQDWFKKDVTTVGSNDFAVFNSPWRNVEVKVVGKIDLQCVKGAPVVDAQIFTTCQFD